MLVFHRFLPAPSRSLNTKGIRVFFILNQGVQRCHATPRQSRTGQAESSLGSTGATADLHPQPWHRELVSGMLAGFVCKVVEYPLDTVKVLMQVLTPRAVKGGGHLHDGGGVGPNVLAYWCPGLQGISGISYSPFFFLRFLPGAKILQRDFWVG